MKKVIYLMVASMLLISMVSCSSSGDKQVGTKYDTIYNVDKIGLTDNFNFITETDNILIKVSESPEGQEPHGGVSGTDFQNSAHELFGCEVDVFIKFLVHEGTNLNVIQRGEYNSPPLDIHVESRYPKDYDYDYYETNVKMLDQLSVLFNFEVTEEVLPRTVYIFYIEEEGLVEKFFVDPPSPYIARANYCDLNINEEANVFYMRLEDYLIKRAEQENVYHVNNTGLDGILALQWHHEKTRWSSNWERLREECTRWGIGIKETTENRLTKVVTFK